LIKNFEISGIAVPPELEELAMIDEKFKFDRMKVKMGVDFAKGYLS
jgi:hypothetical protein